PENRVGVESRDFLKSNPPVMSRKWRGSSSLSREGYSVSRNRRKTARLVPLKASNQSRNCRSAGAGTFVWASALSVPIRKARQIGATAGSQRVAFIVGWLQKRYRALVSMVVHLFNARGTCLDRKKRASPFQALVKRLARRPRIQSSGVGTTS